ncbi:MAG: hypothetical protein GY870_00460 [archaeon]|nr:hypothetical protein [archaeon]
MSITLQQIKLSLIITLLSLISTSFLWADCLDLYNSSHTGGALNIAFEYEKAELESTDNYLSGAAGTETWKAVHDLDGDLYGASIRFEPPVLNRRIRFDFSYLTGELDGTFNTQEISPTPEGPYTGKVKFDRSQWKLGMDIFILNAVYTRLQYFTYKMDGDWVYTDGSPNEPQEYGFNAYSIGAGFRRNFRQKGGDLGVLVNVFAGYSLFEYEHTEKTANVSAESDDIGYELLAELLGTYKLGFGENSFIFAGAGYSYSNTDDTNLDLTQKGITAKLGIRITF